MSCVTDVLLITGLDEPSICSVHDWMIINGLPALKEISNNAGGNKRMQCRVWAGGINHLNIESFVMDCLDSVNWKMPCLVQLLIKEENDFSFRTVFLGPQTWDFDGQPNSIKI